MIMKYGKYSSFSGNEICLFVLFLLAEVSFKCQLQFDMTKIEFSKISLKPWLQIKIRDKNHKDDR